jgi:uncharacterized membrane protein
MNIWAGLPRRLTIFIESMRQVAYMFGMANPNGPVIDMTPDGAFIEPTKPTLGTILARIIAFCILLVVAAVAFWMALFIIPVLIILGVAGYAFARMQVRRY